MSHQLNDYDILFKPNQIFCDNSSAICLSKNLVHQCWTKYIDIKHYFIEDHMIKGEIKILFIGMLDQLADILTKPLLEERFGTLRSALGIISNSH